MRSRTRLSRRRLLRGGLALAGSGLALGCGLPFPAQPPKRRPVLGFLAGGSLSGTPEFAAFIEGLRGLGYVDAATIEIAYRFGSAVSTRASVEELAGAGANAIFATRVSVIRAAREATATIPIVMVASGDPVG